MTAAEILNSANAELLESLYQQYLADPLSVTGDWAEIFSRLDDPQWLNRPLASPQIVSARKERQSADASHGNGHPVSGSEQGSPGQATVGHPPINGSAIAARLAALPDRTGETRTGETRTGETRTGETRTGETRTGETRTGETRTGETRTGETRTGETRTGETQPLVAGVYALVQSYRAYGHLEADINPLQPAQTDHPLLQLSEFNFTPADLDRQVGRANFFGETDGTLRDLVAKLRATYCGRVGVEYLHITDKIQRDWLALRLETNYARPQLTAELKRRLLDGLTRAEGFEQFLDVKFRGKKRFSVEGADVLVPMLDVMISEASATGVKEIVLGMAHRGRLNVLANTLKKPLETLLAEVKDAQALNPEEGDGDVKYHLGWSLDRDEPGGRSIHLSLCYNPSHLELVNPIVEGMVRAKQIAAGDVDGSSRMPVLIHGDAAFTGQGIVMEVLTLCQLRGFQTGGTMHIVIDNQVGFTAEAEECRFTRYPTDIMKVVQAPIFHINADDPEAAAYAVQLAVAYRQTFHKDVMLHVLGYRRHGHNESDEPRFTQPLMYKQIDARPTARTIYEKQLVQEGTLTAAESGELVSKYRAELDAALGAQAAGKLPPKKTTTFGGAWSGLGKAPADLRAWKADTGVAAEKLEHIITVATTIPNNFHPNSKLRLLYDRRREAVLSRKPLDWGVAEALAFGSLLTEGTHVRLVGQDSERGTFSHRQAVLRDTHTGEKLCTLGRLGPGRFTVINSMLSEEAVLGFEYGFSLADPGTLVCWEAQFGDFANGAQAVIDQYIVSAESKWQRHNGLILLLPHGYEGQGPEHSNARPERFLQLAAENNIQVCWPTTPAQYFHLLRRQMRRPFRKPLVVMTPKSLLRYDRSTSTLEELTQGGFRNVIDDPVYDSQPERRADVRRVIFCSGKVYYTLSVAREERKLSGLALVRVEQLYPFPTESLKTVLAGYPTAVEYYWVQEEPRNMGGWKFVQNRFAECLPNGRSLAYRGRKNSASPATGSFAQHEREERELIDESLAHLPSGLVGGPTGGAALGVNVSAGSGSDPRVGTSTGDASVSVNTHTAAFSVLAGSKSK